MAVEDREARKPYIMLCCHVWPVSTPRHMNAPTVSTTCARAADEHGAFQPHEFFAGHFKADGEQQQDHADLRQQFDRVGGSGRAPGPWGRTGRRSAGTPRWAGF